MNNKHWVHVYYLDPDGNTKEQWEPFDTKLKALETAREIATTVMVIHYPEGPEQRDCTAFVPLHRILSVEYLGPKPE